MKLRRRDYLKAAAALLGSAPLTACESIYSHIAKELGEKLPASVNASRNKETDPDFHLLQRAAYGPWPGDLEKVKKTGRAAWLEEQLNPEKIDDRACDLRARRFETIHIPAGACFDFKKEALRKDIVRHTLLRAVYSKRQLLEVMESFWSDHLNISLDKGDCIYLKAADDRLVVRTHALGKFRDLIRASALSPAMLVYLDGNENKKTNLNDRPNENYARELLELHTLGVHGGYSQKDVFEAARCLTGWRLHDKWQRAKVYFDPQRHDNGEKNVLGKTIAAGGGQKDIEQLIEIVCNHPSTAEYISGKLAARFISDPKASFVNYLKNKFIESSGEIKTLLRAILNSEDFIEDRASKIKRPFHLIASTLRALAADTHAHPDLIEYLQRMGQPPFQYPTPDGYPDDALFWMGTLLWRWKFALALCAGQLESVKVDLPGLFKALDLKKAGESEVKTLFAHFTGRLPDSQEFATLNNYMKCNNLEKTEHQAELVGLICSSPAFQRY